MIGHTVHVLVLRPFFIKSMMEEAFIFTFFNVPEMIKMLLHCSETEMLLREKLFQDLMLQWHPQKTPGRPENQTIYFVRPMDLRN